MRTVNTIKKVKLRRGSCKELAMQFGVSTTTVSMAASGFNNSELAQKIRDAAVKEYEGDAIYSK